MSADEAVFDEVFARTGHAGIAHDVAHQATIPKPERCEWCNGTGNELYAMYRRCPKCGGSGLHSDYVASLRFEVEPTPGEKP